MPLSEEEKRQRLVASGLNPDEYDFVEAPAIEHYPNYQPEVPPVATGPTAPTPFETFKGAAARSLVPTGGFMAGARAGFALAPTIPHPVFGPLVKIGGSLLGGLGGSMLGGYGQEKVLEKAQGPEAYQAGLEKLSQGREANPISAIAGDIGPTLPFMGPGGLKTAITGLGKVPLAGVKLSNIEKGAIGNLGFGMGMGAGTEAIREKVQGEELDPTKIIGYGLGGAATMSPTKLGSKLMGPGFPQVDYSPEAYVPPAQSTPIKPKEVLQLPERTGPIITPEPTKAVEVVEGNPVKDPLGKDYLNLKEQLSEATPSAAAELNKQEGVPVERQIPLQTSGAKIMKEPGAYSEAGEGPRLTPEEIEKGKLLAQKRGVTLETKPTIISEETGQPARGYAAPAERRAVISDIATSDTPAHEVVGHIHFEDLKHSDLQSDREFYARGLKHAGSEEALAEAAGKRIAEIESKPLRTWVEDLKSSAKRWAKVTSGEDDVNILARKGRDDRPYAESPELHNTAEKIKKYYSEAPESGVSGGSREEGEHSPAFLKILQPLVEDLRQQGSSGQKAATAVENTERETSRLNGEFTNKFVDAATKIKNKEEAARYIHETAVGGKATSVINTADKKIIDEELYPIYKKVHETQRELGLKVKTSKGELRDALDNPNRRGPLSASQEVIDTLIKKPENNVQRQALVKDFVDFQVKQTGVSKADAEEMLRTYLRGFAGPTSKSTASFNALRKAEGIGIPYSWMEKDPVKLFNRYGQRVSRDLAFFKNIESDDELRAIFGITNQEGDAPLVKGVEPLRGNSAKVAYERLTGQHTANEAVYNAFEHFVRGLILGPLTGAKNTVSTLAQLLPYVPVKDLPKIAEAFKFIKKGFKDSMDLGVNRHSITSLETNAPDTIGRFADRLKTLGDIARKYSGANAIEQWTRAHNMALGEILMEANYGRAVKGDIEARAFLKKFAPEVNWTKPLTDEIIKEGAARFVERVQGTYGARGLPTGLLKADSPVYWFMSLSKWSVEKSNVIKQDVINPALEGNYGPLLRYALGGLLTGEVIRVMTEELSAGKKAQTPDLVELQDKGSADDYAHKVFELSSLAGLAGIMSDLPKMAMDVAKGNRTRGYTIPSYEIAADLAGEVSAASQAIADGQNPLDVVVQLGQNILTDNVQALRMVSNVANPEDVDRANKFRDKRVYDKLDGKKVPQPSTRLDRYGGMAEREFKRAKTTEEAGKIYEEKLKSKLSTLSKEEKLKELSSLRKNSYQVVPADWKESEEYYAYIKRTQGEEAARLLREDKKKQDLVNRQKQKFLRP